MPVEFGVEIRPVGQEELARRCRLGGLEVHREVALHARHEGFAKPYYIDLLVEGGAVYELKAVEKLNGSHQKQLINYLLLGGLCHGKVVNFRPGSVESRFVSTGLRHQDRAVFNLVDREWQGDDASSERLRRILCSLLTDWGAFLDLNLYREALVHFLDGPEAGVHPVDIVVGGCVVGAQRMCLLAAGNAWHLSAVRQHLESYETHLIRLLSHTRLDRIHWINLDQQIVTLKTLNK